MNEWIWINNRLPADKEKVLIKLHYKKDCIITAIFLIDFVTSEKTYDHGVFVMDIPPRILLKYKDHRQFYFDKQKVTYWMPLPQPPKVC